MALLEGKVALVTGAASGIGRATALRFAQEGARVVLVDVNDAEGEAARQLVERRGGEAAYWHADVADPAQVEAVVRGTIDRYGRLDCAFNNAAILGETGRSTADYALENWACVLSVGLTGVFLCCKYEIPAMLAGGGGTIVNTSSSVGLVGDRGCVAYVAAKHGVVGLTRAVALEYATRNIRVNAIAPGATRTAMMEALIGDDRATEDQIVAREPVGRMGEPEELAAAVVWLCSNEASFITGHTMSVDGGQVVSP